MELMQESKESVSVSRERLVPTLEEEEREAEIKEGVEHEISVDEVDSVNSLKAKNDLERSKDSKSKS